MDRAPSQNVVGRRDGAIGRTSEMLPEFDGPSLFGNVYSGGGKTGSVAATTLKTLPTSRLAERDALRVPRAALALQTRLFTLGNRAIR